MNEKLGLDPAFLNEENPYNLFKVWMKDAEKSEINDPNALSVATVDSVGQPDNRMVLLKGLTEEGFVFYTNLESKKGKDKSKSQSFHVFSLEITSKTSENSRFGYFSG
jgi:pyridoxamine 5'-phosphate oxidase